MLVMALMMGAVQVAAAAVVNWWRVYVLASAAAVHQMSLDNNASTVEEWPRAQQHTVEQLETETPVL